ncbi:urease accessory protein F-like isoform X2 [Mizuhopecten yessoensis]|uniref:urease accessory protein F-like isoform X2 n=1 Tax=Mizuhopecten yessoensis TaxID=6573 RepID=UPI000B45EEF8|nr:urease accessory protein F-like isoform X2 [Mizuhopecten yessoensis]
MNLKTTYCVPWKTLNYNHVELNCAGSFCLPFVREAHDAYLESDKLIELDSLCEACTANHVANRASVRQGRSLLDTSSKAFRVEQILELKGSLEYCHHSVVFGCVCGAMGVDLFTTLTTYLFSSLRTVVAAAVRLDQIGAIQAQVVQTELQSRIPEILERHQSRSTDETCLLNPLVDVFQNTHDTMFSKLFYS